jgi:hypothetical protein
VLPIYLLTMEDSPASAECGGDHSLVAEEDALHEMLEEKLKRVLVAAQPDLLEGQ